MAKVGLLSTEGERKRKLPEHSSHCASKPPIDKPGIGRANIAQVYQDSES